MRETGKRGRVTVWYSQFVHSEYAHLTARVPNGNRQYPTYYSVFNVPKPVFSLEPAPHA
jgi:hypothetical protein